MPYSSPKSSAKESQIMWSTVRTALLSLLLTTLSIYALGQGGNFVRQVSSGTVANGGTGQVIPGAIVRICTSTATGTPCSPLVSNVYSDQALTQSIGNPFAADINGFYSIFLPTGVFIIQETAPPGAGYTYTESFLIFVNGTGTVSSVGLALPSSVFSVSGSPVTSSGTLTGAFISQSANQVFGNCTSGSAIPLFCSLTANMIPGTLNPTTINGNLTVTGNEALTGNLTVGGSATITGNSISANSYTQEGPFACAEWYLTSPMAGDYGQAINAAVQAQSLLLPSTVKLCAPGNHPVSTPIVIDRPIHFISTGSKLIPQSALGSSPVSTTNATVTAGSSVISVSSTAGFAVNQPIGGLGLIYGSYITNIGSGTVTVSLPPSLTVDVVPNGTTTVKVAGSLSGFNVGQTIAGFGVTPGTTISSISATTDPQTMTLSNTVPAQLTPIALTVTAGTWTVPTLTALSTNTVMTWTYNSSALHNEFGQMIGGGMNDVWIADTAIRSVQGLRGIQIYGWDRLSAYNTTVELLDGSGLVMGGITPGGTGNGSVRESYFFNTDIRYCGDIPSGQSAIELITGYSNGSSGADEINQIGIVGGSVVDEFGESLTIGTYNPSHTLYNGPRLIWLTGNVQFEGGNFLNPTYPRVQTQADTIHLIQVDDIYFTGSEMFGSGFGKAVIRMDQVNTVVATGSSLKLSSPTTGYTVSVTNGSPNISWVSGPDGGDKFVTDGSWNGIAGLVVDGGSCTTVAPCVVHLAATGGVPSNTSILLAASYTGTTDGTATLYIPTEGWLFNVTNFVNQLNTKDDQISFSLTNPNDLAPMQITEPILAAYVGVSAAPPGVQQTNFPASNIPQSIGFLNIANLGSSLFNPISWRLAANTIATGAVQDFFGADMGNNDALVNEFLYTSANSTSNVGSWRLSGSTNRCTLDTTGNLACPIMTVAGASIKPPLSGVTGTITGTSLSGTCDSGTAAITGAVVGSPVAVSSTTGADVGGAFNLRASVTSTSVVTVYVCGTGTPASLAYNVRVFP
jgi:hypothetical protein